VAEKVDHLKLCNEHKIPFQDFEAQFCSRCLQPECTRSQSGKSKFEQRVATWENRLFLNVARMDSRDERFQPISAQKFLGVNPGTQGSQSSWDDPRTIETTKLISLPEPTPPAPEPVRAAPPEEKLPELELIPVTVPVTEPAPAPANSPQVLRNTPNRSRQMIGNATPPVPVPVLDPWQPKQPLKPGEHLVEPGARIKLGE
jgi:hypothetical protein